MVLFLRNLPRHLSCQDYFLSFVRLFPFLSLSDVLLPHTFKTELLKTETAEFQFGVLCFPWHTATIQ